MSAQAETTPYADSSISVPLGVRGWIGVLVVLMICVIVLPRVWEQAEAFEPNSSWRQPTRGAEDYWQFQRWMHHAEHEDAIVILGDSAAWGEFARPSETLAARLSQSQPEVKFANLGVQGLYPIALHGLLRMESPNSPPLLLFNPIWMTSTRRDLSLHATEREPVSMNHKALLPQFLEVPPAYQASVEERLGRWVLQQSELRRWSSHLSYEYLEGRDLPTWLRVNPSRFPWQAIDGEVQGPDDAPGQPVRQRPIPENSVSYEWVAPDDSLQYQAFLNCVDLLKRQGNPPLVLLANLNSSGRTLECLERESKLGQRLIADLRTREVAVVNLKALPEDMADASHPTPEGYQQWAATIHRDLAFQNWLEEQHPAIH